MANRWFFHGIPTLAGVIFSVVFNIIFFIRNKGKTYKQKLLPLRLLAAVMILLEIVKIIYLVKRDGVLAPSFYPVIFCSIFMYTYPMIAHLDENNPYCRIAKAMSVFPALVIGLLYIFILPKVSTFRWNSFWINFHSRFYHFMMLTAAVYIIINRLYDYRRKDYVLAFLAAAAYFTFCTVISLLIGGDISYFGPMSGPLKAVYSVTGYATGNFLVIMACFAVGFLIYLFIDIVAKLNLRQKKK